MSIMDITTPNTTMQSRGPRLALSVDEAARALGVSRRHIYMLFELAELRSFTSRRRRLVRVSELEAYIERRERGAA